MSCVPGGQIRMFIGYISGSTNRRVLKKKIRYKSDPKKNAGNYFEVQKMAARGRNANIKFKKPIFSQMLPI